MAGKNINKSRLSEIDFSSYNLRDAYITEIPEYYSALRDEAIFSNYGIKVLVRIPADDDFNYDENDVDEYSNYVNVNWIDTVESIVPKFTEYRQNVSEHGMSADGTDGLYPLECLIPTKLHLPRNSRIVFSEYDSNENKIVREWTVLGTQMKQLSGSKTYTRIAECVPSRQESFTSANIEEHTFWFDYLLRSLNKDNQIRAQGNIWFIHSIPNRSLIKRCVKSDIYEQAEDMYAYIEVVKESVFYDFRPCTIQNGGHGFKVNEEFVLKDPAGNDIYIEVKENARRKEPLVLTVLAVDNDGAIMDYKLNVERGYTSFGTDGTLDVTVRDAVIRLTAIDMLDENLQESLNSNATCEVRYIHPYMSDSRFTAKSIAVSVLS